jgi:hypothetical protein
MNIRDPLIGICRLEPPPSGKCPLEIDLCAAHQRNRASGQPAMTEINCHEIAVGRLDS